MNAALTVTVTPGDLAGLGLRPPAHGVDMIDALTRCATPNVCLPTSRRAIPAAADMRGPLTLQVAAADLRPASFVAREAGSLAAAQAVFDGLARHPTLFLPPPGPMPDPDGRLAELLAATEDLSALTPADRRALHAEMRVAGDL